MSRPLTLVALAWLLGACATVRAGNTICPEYRDLRCLTGVECSMVAQRGCQACQCSPAYVPENALPQSGIPPDRRNP